MNNNQKISRTSRRVEVVNPDGSITRYSSISKAAKAMKKHAAQIYTLAINGKVKILNGNVESNRKLPVDMENLMGRLTLLGKQHDEGRKRVLELERLNQLTEKLSIKT